MSAWGQFEIRHLMELLEDYAEDAALRVRVRFPDLDYAVEDWMFEVVDSPTGPMIVTSVYETDFDYPLVAGKLKRVADRLAYYNCVDIAEPTSYPEIQII